MDEKMSLLVKVIKTAGRKSWTRLMDRVGGKLVSRMADTSADAPSAFHKPKRDVYKDMNQDTSTDNSQEVDPDEKNSMNNKTKGWEQFLID